MRENIYNIALTTATYVSPQLSRADSRELRRGETLRFLIWEEEGAGG